VTQATDCVGEFTVYVIGGVIVGAVSGIITAPPLVVMLRHRKAAKEAL
jgi:preprotein translocase subunit SecF